MDHIKELEKLIKTDILLEVEENINEIENDSSNKKNKSYKEDLQYMLDIKKYFDEILEDIKLENITQEEAIDILEGLEEMKTENQEI